jgi:hypothetical protein
VIWPVVLWIDPGQMTGIAWLYESGTQFRAAEYDFFGAAMRIEQTALQFGPVCAMGWERYTIRPGVPQTNAYDAIGMIGAARYFATRYRCHILDPAPPMTPTPHDRRRLEAIGWWTPGKDDAQSAASHMLKWLERSRNVPPREAAILSELAGNL